MKTARIGLAPVIMVVFLVLGASSATVLRAQQKPTISNRPLQEGQHVIRGNISKDASAVEVKVDGKKLVGDDVEIKLGGGIYRAELKAPLQEGQKVEVVQIVGGNPSPPQMATVGALLVDTRDTVEVSFYVGTAIDSFASEDLNNLINSGVSGDIKARGVGGFDFAARLVGTQKEKDGKNVSWDPQLWVYGETVHGTRSSDVDCTKNSAFPTCKNALADPNRLPTQTFLLLRNATSLEGFAGLRFEFLSLQRESEFPMNVYLKGQGGFLTIANGPDDAAGVHHGGVGIIVTRGPLEGSYLEGGFGISDFFNDKPKDRWKFDALVSYAINETVSFFGQITMDTDIGDGPDSFQTYFGFDFDLIELVKTFKKAGT